MSFTLRFAAAAGITWIYLCGACVSSALAATPNIVVVVHARDSASKRAAQYMSYGFREALAKQPDRFVLASQAGLYGDREIDLPKIKHEADALVQEGLALYDGLELDKAQTKLDAALQVYENNLGELDSLKPVARVALLSAGNALLNKNERAGRALIQRALLYDPSAQPDPRIYNASMLATFKDVRARSARAHKGSLAITTNPAYAELYVDGDFVGMTPDKVDAISDGPHLVRVVRDGFRGAFEVVDVKSARNDTTQTLNLVAMPEQMQVQALIEKAGFEMSRSSSQAASALAARAHAMYVLVCSVGVNGDQVRVNTAVFHADNHRVAVRDKTFSALSDTFREEAASLWDKLQGDVRAAALMPRTDTGTEERLHRDSKVKPIVTGLLLGLGGAAVVGGTICGVMALVEQAPYRQLPQISSEVPRRQAQLRTLAGAADGLIISGAALVTAGILAFVLWDDRPANKERLGALPFQLDVAVTPMGAYAGARGSF
jgi:PEGA domain